MREFGMREIGMREIGMREIGMREFGMREFRRTAHGSVPATLGAPTAGLVTGIHIDLNRDFAVVWRALS